MDIRKSMIVQSIAGHDKGSPYYVVDTEGCYALLVNGRTRRMENPKRKKLKHLRFGRVNCGIAAEKLRRGEDVTSKEIRKGLAEYAAYPANYMEVC